MIGHNSIFSNNGILGLDSGGYASPAVKASDSGESIERNFPRKGPKAAHSQVFDRARGIYYRGRRDDYTRDISIFNL